MESHRAHITKMEIMLRMLDNDSLDPDTVFAITDDFKFYLDKAEEGQLEDVLYVYEGIDLEEVSKFNWPANLRFIQMFMLGISFSEGNS